MGDIYARETDHLIRYLTILVRFIQTILCLLMFLFLLLIIIFLKHGHVMGTFYGDKGNALGRSHREGALF